MNLAGLQKLTLLDYPQHTACTIFTSGCNMRCPFCHNSSIIEKQYNTIEENFLFDFLKSRIGLLDGVCITGGEPTIQNDIKRFIKEIKNIGFLVKLDTNGSNPEVIKDLIESGLIDYIAMDIKNSFDKYSMTCGILNFDVDKVKESINYIINSDIDYEFRTTIVKDYHTVSDVKRISNYLVGCKKYFLQYFKKSDDVLDSRCCEPDIEDLKNMRDIAKENIDYVGIRGIDID